MPWVSFLRLLSLFAAPPFFFLPPFHGASDRASSRPCSPSRRSPASKKVERGREKAQKGVNDDGRRLSIGRRMIVVAGGHDVLADLELGRSEIDEQAVLDP